MSARATAAFVAIAAGCSAIAAAGAAWAGYTLPALIAGGLLMAAGMLRATGW